MDVNAFKPYIAETWSVYEKDPDLFDIPYKIEEIEKQFNVIKLETGWIVFHQSEEVWGDFFVFDKLGSFEEEETEITVANILFYGSGTLGELRELRHTYFNPYIFYINATTIEGAFKELRKHFDI